MTSFSKAFPIRSLKSWHSLAIQNSFSKGIPCFSKMILSNLCMLAVRVNSLCISKDMTTYGCYCFTFCRKIKFTIGHESCDSFLSPLDVQSFILIQVYQLPLGDPISCNLPLRNPHYLESLECFLNTPLDRSYGVTRWLSRDWSLDISREPFSHILVPFKRSYSSIGYIFWLSCVWICNN